MEPNAALFAAILATPSDDLPRRVYADWLEENGDAEHAELIRYQCQSGRHLDDCGQSEVDLLRGCPGCTDQLSADCVLDPNPEVPGGEGLAARWRSTFAGGHLFLATSPPPPWWQPEIGSGSSQPAHAYGVVERGFINRVWCSIAWWLGGDCRVCQGIGRRSTIEDWLGEDEQVLTHSCEECAERGLSTAFGPLVVASHPVEMVTFTDVPFPVPTRDGEQICRIVAGDLGPLWSLLPPRLTQGAGENYLNYDVVRQQISAAAVAWARDPNRVQPPRGWPTEVPF